MAPVEKSVLDQVNKSKRDGMTYEIRSRWVVEIRSF